MAYATGSAATVDDLLEAIENFAIGEGWVIDKRAVDQLFLHKGICHVTMQKRTQNFNRYETGAAVSFTDNILAMALNVTNNPALANYFGHPGSLVTALTDADAVNVNHFENGIAEYFLFSGDTAAGDPDYIHCAMRVSADHWRHLSFGLLQQGELTHSGVAYLCGSSGYFFANQTNPTSSSQYMNQPGYAPYPFGTPGTDIGGVGNAHYCPDALPNTASWGAMTTSRQRDLVITYNDARQYPTSSDQSDNSWCDLLMGAPVSEWGGVAPMIAAPVLMETIDSSYKFCFVGDYPNVRLINIEGLQPGQELTYGSDTWVVTPIGCQRSWGTQAELGLQYSTGHYGLAFKKIV